MEIVISISMHLIDHTINLVIENTITRLVRYSSTVVIVPSERVFNCENSVDRATVTEDVLFLYIFSILKNK